MSVDDEEASEKVDLEQRASAPSSSPTADVTADVETAVERAVRLQNYFEEFCNPETTPVVKDTWLWEHHKRDHYYEPDGTRPADEDDETIPFDREEALGYPVDELDTTFDRAVRLQNYFEEFCNPRRRRSSKTPGCGNTTSGCITTSPTARDHVPKTAK